MSENGRQGGAKIQKNCFEAAQLFKASIATGSIQLQDPHKCINTVVFEGPRVVKRSK